MKIKISLDRVRPRKGALLRLPNDMPVEVFKFKISSSLKKTLAREAKARGYSMSLFLNLVLAGQENPPKS